MRGAYQRLRRRATMRAWRDLRLHPVSPVVVEGDLRRRWPDSRPDTYHSPSLGGAMSARLRRVARPSALLVQEWTADVARAVPRHVSSTGTLSTMIACVAVLGTERLQHHHAVSRTGHARHGASSVNTPTETQPTSGAHKCRYESNAMVCADRHSRLSRE
jgi:hypothetical protein